MSDEGKEHLKICKHSRDVTKGIYTGYSEKGRVILILREGYKSPAGYHPTFWELDTKGGKG